MKYQFITLLCAIALLLGIDSKSTIKNDNYTCNYGGKKYKLGEKIDTPDTACLLCDCHRGFEQPSASPPNDCAIIDCPWEYYESKPHCHTKYIAGECCPELRCSPPSPDLDAAFLTRKKGSGSTNGYEITAKDGSELTIYCIPDQATDDLSGKNVEWKHKKSDGAVETVSNTTETALAFFSPSTWALYFPKLRAIDGGSYTCIIPTKPPQTQTTRIIVRTEPRPPLIDPICYKPAFSNVQNNPCPKDKENRNLPWYFSSKDQRCVQHKEKSCKWAKENHFASNSECWKHCLDACYDQSEIGRCEALMKRYFYDHSSDKCETFNYGGCGGNRNNFKSVQECEDACADIKYRKVSDKKLH